jgi:hypothetical protein
LVGDHDRRVSGLVTSDEAARMPVESATWERLQLAGQIIIVKLAVVLVVFLAYKLLPFNAAAQQQHFVDRAHSESALEQLFTTWDGQIYLYVSEAGYAPEQFQDIQFPLYPALIRLATPLFSGNSVVAALVVSNLASLIAFVLLFDLVAEHLDASTARRTLVVAVAFPTAFFFCLVYSEAVFLLLVVLFFRFLLHGQLGRAAIPAALLPLARSPGVLIALPFAAYYLQRVRPLVSTRALWPASPVLGLLVYFGIMYAATGNPLEMARMAELNGSGFSAGALLHPLRVFSQFAGQPLQIHGYTNSILDRAFFLGFLALLAPIFRRLPLPFALYALAMGTISVLGGSFEYYTRYVLVVFPVFIVLAQLLARDNWTWLWRPLVFVFAMLQGLLLVMQATFYWVA